LLYAVSHVREKEAALQAAIDAENYEAAEKLQAEIDLLKGGIDTQGYPKL